MAAEHGGPVSRTNGAGPRRIKNQESVAGYPFRGGVSLGGIASRVVPSLSLSPPGAPSVARSYIRCFAHRYSFYFFSYSLPFHRRPLLYIIILLLLFFLFFFLLFADRVFGFFSTIFHRLLFPRRHTPLWLFKDQTVRHSDTIGPQRLERDASSLYLREPPPSVLSPYYPSDCYYYYHHEGLLRSRLPVGRRGSSFVDGSPKVHRRTITGTVADDLPGTRRRTVSGAELPVHVRVRRTGGQVIVRTKGRRPVVCFRRLPTVPATPAVQLRTATTVLPGFRIPRRRTVPYPVLGTSVDRRRLPDPVLGLPVLSPTVLCSTVLGPTVQRRLLLSISGRLPVVLRWSIRPAVRRRSVQQPLLRRRRADRHPVLGCLPTTTTAALVVVLQQRRRRRSTVRLVPTVPVTAVPVVLRQLAGRPRHRLSRLRFRQ